MVFLPPLNLIKLVALICNWMPLLHEYSSNDEVGGIHVDLIWFGVFRQDK
ncbi:hypothetical protein CCACVL1_11667 [Corchorus capsularis]|uniref:Uncharacterized protein n=1 Tax=Corchorus capsularis TaxID=210143 RepID=A0A1R3IK31_COCAP|nr:hypothetical protein CCACVL1_11667 [Corchorus capsularis]